MESFLEADSPEDMVMDWLSHHIPADEDMPTLPAGLAPAPLTTRTVAASLHSAQSDPGPLAAICHRHATHPSEGPNAPHQDPSPTTSAFGPGGKVNHHQQQQQHQQHPPFPQFACAAAAAHAPAVPPTAAAPAADGTGAGVSGGGPAGRDLVSRQRRPSRSTLESTPRGGRSDQKGLRSIMPRVCCKLRAHGRITLPEIADSIVAELCANDARAAATAAAAAGQPPPAAAPSTAAAAAAAAAAQGTEPSTRRRVNDAINALIGVGLVAREGKDIVWKGNDGGWEGGGGGAGAAVGDEAAAAAAQLGGRVAAQEQALLSLHGTVRDLQQRVVVLQNLVIALVKSQVKSTQAAAKDGPGGEDGPSERGSAGAGAPGGGPTTDGSTKLPTAAPQPAAAPLHQQQQQAAAAAQQQQQQRAEQGGNSLGQLAAASAQLPNPPAHQDQAERGAFRAFWPSEPSPPPAEPLHSLGGRSSGAASAPLPALPFAPPRGPNLLSAARGASPCAPGLMPISMTMGMPAGGSGSVGVPPASDSARSSASTAMQLDRRSTLTSGAPAPGHPAFGLPVGSTPCALARISADGRWRDAASPPSEASGSPAVATWKRSRSLPAAPQPQQPQPQPLLLRQPAQLRQPAWSPFESAPQPQQPQQQQPQLLRIAALQSWQAQQQQQLQLQQQQQFQLQQQQQQQLQAQLQLNRLSSGVDGNGDNSALTFACPLPLPTQVPTQHHSTQQQQHNQSDPFSPFTTSAPLKPWCWAAGQQGRAPAGQIPAAAAAGGAAAAASPAAAASGDATLEEMLSLPVMDFEPQLPDLHLLVPELQQADATLS